MVVSYKLLLDTESRSERDRLRARFYKVLFYQLKDRLCETYLRSDTLDMITRFITSSRLIDCEFNTVKQNIRKWAQSGGKYDALCRDLAEDEEDVNGQEYGYLGTLFRLPDDVTDRSLKDLPNEGHPGKSRLIVS
ncbi:uncharacterized protein ACHE_10932S [Aspergillus chevalieri]|uniref:Uncharacterized protein n=1 Tax=Aspergillus chevalieri TaxID=182096 RepID=A0A7R7VEW4_ASPCH|nr:uncharacterized protein ACHE_10932S [Aspergillus chevalieri]BCR83530.1 hypothetical protein ACHE_10932S [Aspergillus chevalieri]